MALIINQGSERDPRALPLFTRAGNFIANERNPPLRRERMLEALELHRRDHPDAMVRSLVSTHNCMGLLFASRRTLVDMEQWDLIQADDGYRKLDESEAPMPGDVVLYRDRHHRPSHVAQIIRVDLDIARAEHHVEVVSQWGRDGEYIHKIADVPFLLGAPAEIWTERSFP